MRAKLIKEKKLTDEIEKDLSKAIETFAPQFKAPALYTRTTTNEPRGRAPGEYLNDMANLRLLVNRRKAIRNIRKITRTMELIATARFKKAMDRASEAAAYTQEDWRTGCRLVSRRG